YANRSPYPPVVPASFVIPRPGFLPPIIGPGSPWGPWEKNAQRSAQDIWTFFRKFLSSSGGYGDPDDDDECEARRAREVRRCKERSPDAVHPSFEQACIERANTRWRQCKENGGKPSPNEMPEWGNKDEEVWRNYDR